MIPFPTIMELACNKTHLEQMRSVFEDVCTEFEGQLVEFDGEREYVHLLVNYLPKVQLSKRVNSLKGVSSRRLRRRGAY